MRLKLSDMGLNTIDAITELPKLTRLELARNKLQTLPELSGLAALTRIDLRENLLTQLDGMAGANRLESLDLSKNPLNSFAGLSENRELRRLSINEIQEGRLSDISTLSLSRLTEIRAGGNGFRSVKGFLAFPDLEVLVVSNNEIQSLQPLSSLKKLTYLEAVGNPLSTQNCPLKDPDYCRFDWERILLNQTNQ
jgi:internalin A